MLSRLEEHTNLTSLQHLCLSNCRKLRDLKSLDFTDCRTLKWFLGVWEITNLDSLVWSRCTRFCESHGLENLQELSFFRCDDTSKRLLPDLSMLTKLTFLNVSNTPGKVLEVYRGS
jgi:hypothetical protein